MRGRGTCIYMEFQEVHLDCTPPGGSVPQHLTMEDDMNIQLDTSALEHTLQELERLSRKADEDRTKAKCRWCGKEVEATQAYCSLRCFVLYDEQP